MDGSLYMPTTLQTRKNRQQLTAGYNQFSGKLNLYANSRMHSREASEDLVQDAFKKAWAYLYKGGKIDMMEAFLYHILRGLIIDVYRKRTSTSLDVLLEKGFEPSVDETARMQNVFDGSIAIRLIQSLSPQYRKVIHMKYVQDLSLKEISLITGQTKNTIAVQIHRGLEKMRALYNCTK
jgi:RNA polymerase sigma-70 factor, ECF subfamily